MKATRWMLAALFVMFAALLLPQSASAEAREDGTYTVNFDMVRADDPSRASMSDAAAVKPAEITILNGNYSVRCAFHGLSIAGQKGYLKELSYWNGSDFAQTDVDEAYSFIDDFGFNDENEDGVPDYLYPHILSFPLLNGEAGDVEDGYVRLRVFVPVMESLNTGSGTQEVFMKIDWSSLKPGTAEFGDDSGTTDSEPDVQKPAQETTGGTSKGTSTKKAADTKQTAKTTAKTSAKTPAKKAVTVAATAKVSAKNVKGKKAKVTWKKVKGADGYEIYRSVKKSTGYKKVGTVKKGTKVTFTDKKLKKKKTYYYRVRAYRKSGGKQIYSVWSKAAKVKIKK